MPYSNAPVSVGVHTVTSAEAGAHTLTIATGLIGASSIHVTVIRSGVVYALDANVSIAASTGVLTVADGSNYKVTTTDLIHWLVA